MAIFVSKTLPEDKTKRVGVGPLMLALITQQKYHI